MKWVMLLVVAVFFGAGRAPGEVATREVDMAGEVRQVFANLVGNAIDATSAGGRLVVRARRSRSWEYPGVSGVRFTVADTGDGMEQDVRERVFEAFFTTKENTGTGLGLWVSHEIILKHRGIVHVRSKAGAPGQVSGTVFQIFIPDNEKLITLPRPADVLKAGTA